MMILLYILVGAVAIILISLALFWMEGFLDNFGLTWGDVILWVAGIIAFIIIAYGIGWFVIEVIGSAFRG